MTAPNHALTGAVIGLTVVNPWLAIPFAFLSHFILDVIPHFGYANLPGDVDEIDAWLWQKKSMKLFLLLQFVLCVGLVGVLFTTQTSNWLLASVCAFIATTPDLYSVPRFLKAAGLTETAPKWDSFRRFHQALQHESVLGAIVEIIWAGVMVALLWQIIR